ncbi:MAG: PVC-type heme-binding CxxCH protein [Pirellulaceae bacterium]
MPSQFPSVTIRVSSVAAFCLGLAVAMARADESKPANSQEETIKPLTPDEALKALQLPPGFKATLFAAEPAVQQPIAMAWDERGRLWVAECYTYAESAKGFDKEQKDRIIILEDTDGDGKHDKRTVFWDKGDKLTSIEVGFGGVWALCAPNLLFIPDKNRDDVPDGPPVVKLDGWDGDSVRHNIVNGLKWGPDGWLYGRHGILATSPVGKPGSSDSQRAKVSCGMWRYHPTRETVEVVCHGTTNPWGHDWDEHGELFMINTVIGHLWHVVPGSHFRRMYGADANPHTYELMEQTADHFHWDQGEVWSDIRKIGVSPTTDKAGGGHAHSGLMIYLGDNWPAEYRNNVFTINLHGKRINRDKLVRKGAGYTATHGEDFLKSSDPYFRAVDLNYGPDGGVYVMDWSDIGECHENDGVHRTSGRIYKITYGKTKHIAVNLAKESNEKLMHLLYGRNEWYVRQAQRVMQERASDMKERIADEWFREPSDDEVESRGDINLTLRVLRRPFITGIKGEGVANGEHEEALEVKVIMDDEVVTEENIEFLEQRMEKDRDGLVCLYLAAALQKMPVQERWRIATPLAKMAQFANDPQLPLLIWYGIEPAVAKDLSRGIKLIEATKMPTLRRLTARRITEELEQNPAAANDLVTTLAKHEDEQFRLDVLEGMSQALRGWRKAPAPKSWGEISAVLAKSDSAKVKEAAQKLGVVFGEGRAIEEVKQLVTNEGADAAIRTSALSTLIQDRGDDLLPLLKKLAGDRLLAPTAIRGLASYTDAEVPALILNTYDRLTPDGRSAAISTLSSRPEYAAELLKAIEAGKLKRQEITAFHARQIRSFENEKLSEQLAKVWGEVRVSGAEKKQLMAQLKEANNKETLAKANPSAGRALFTKTCANCHVLYGQGKTGAGPDLTGSNRRNLDYLLENIVDPSASVAADFKATLYRLADGRTLTGVIVEQTEKTLTLQTATERPTIAREDIEDSKPTGQSLMPDGLLQPLSPEQVRDLFAYLMTTEQVPLK